MTESAKPSAFGAPKKAATILVEAIKAENEHEWVHEGKTMKAGDQAEVTLDQAQRLEKVGAVRVVR
jgi:hypothetical protein